MNDEKKVESSQSEIAQSQDQLELGKISKKHARGACLGHSRGGNMLHDPLT